MICRLIVPATDWLHNGITAIHRFEQLIDWRLTGRLTKPRYLRKRLDHSLKIRSATSDLLHKLYRRSENVWIDIVLSSVCPLTSFLPQRGNLISINHDKRHLRTWMWYWTHLLSLFNQNGMVERWRCPPLLRFGALILNSPPSCPCFFLYTFFHRQESPD